MRSDNLQQTMTQWISNLVLLFLFGQVMGVNIDLKTQCKIKFTYASHCISKNLTPRRMLKKSLLIAKINNWNNSFQNMYVML